MAEFSLSVPVLTVGAVSKRWLAPGWRLGWIAVCDPHGILTKAKVSPPHVPLDLVVYHQLVYFSQQSFIRAEAGVFRIFDISIFKEFF